MNVRGESIGVLLSMDKDLDLKKHVAFLQRNSSGLFVRERQLYSNSVVITICTSNKQMMFDPHTRQESPSSTCNEASKAMGKPPPLVRLVFVDKDHW